MCIIGRQFSVRTAIRAARRGSAPSPPIPPLPRPTPIQRGRREGRRRERHRKPTWQGRRGRVKKGPFRQGEGEKGARAIGKFKDGVSTVVGTDRPGESARPSGRGRGKGGGEGNRQIFYSLCFGIAITGTWQRRSFQKVNFSLL